MLVPSFRRIVRTCFLLWLLVLLAPGSARALEMDLMQGDLKKGTVPMIERNGERFAALDEMLTRLGFALSPVTGGLVVTYSGKKIEFWNGSNVARISGTVYTMPFGVFSSDGHWWGEANAAIQVVSQFLSSVSRPSDIRWREPQSAAGASVPAALPVAPSMKTSEAPRRTGGGASVSRVRWGEQVDAYRAVVDISEQVDVTLREYSDRLEVTFSGAKTSSFSSTSPWPPLSVSAGQSAEGVTLTFKHASKAVKGFWVADPPRYVVDFYFDRTQPASVPAATAEGRKIETTPARTPASSAGKKFRVVVDAGHGGHDPGAVGNGLKEKDINLKATNELIASLKALGLDVKATRTNDRYLKLAERTAFANNQNADIFISLHCNALPKGQHASGVEIYLMAEHTDKDALNLAIIENREISGEAQNAAEINAAADKRTQLLLKILGDMQQSDKLNESTTLAEHLYDRMRGVGYSIRKVRQAPFFVLRGAGMPAVLVEMGYITESSDAKLLNSQAYRKKMMDALASGILNYLKNRPGEGGR